jgi:predicted amidohydrolase YtcJ
MAVHHALAADLLLINGRVLTMDVHDSMAQAVAMQDGKIVAVGTHTEVELLAGVSATGAIVSCSCSHQ